MTVKLGTEHIQAVAAFEKLTGVFVKDCLITDDCIYFLIKPGKMGLAIGKNGANIKKVRDVFKKQVKIFEYSENPEVFVKNVIQNIKTFSLNDGVVTISIPPKDRSMVIGKNGKNIKILRDMLNRNFNIKNLRLK